MIFSSSPRSSQMPRHRSQTSISTPAFVTSFSSALHFLLGGAVTRFHMLKYGLALVLIFVGLKMAWLNDLWNGKFPIGWSLAIIGVLIGASLALSLVIAPRPSAARPSVDSR